MPRLLCPGYCTPCHLPAFLPVSCPGYSAQATENPASCLPVCLLDRLLCPGYCTPCHMPACLFAGQATLPRLLHTLSTACLPVCWQGYSAQQNLPPDCMPACLLARLFCPGYSAQATAHPATCLPACLLARLLCPSYCTPCHLPACPFAGQATLPSKHCRLTACLPVCWQGCSAQATLPRLLHTLPPACLHVCWPGYSAQATAHPATCLLGAQATLPRLLNTLPPTCLFAWPGYSAQANAHPATCLPACLLARLLCPGYCTLLPPACLLASVCWPVCFVPRLLFPGYCTPCHLPACLYGCQASLPRLLNTLPPACLPVCWTGYSAQATAHPATLPVCLFAGQAIVPRLVFPGYCTPCHLPAFLPVSCQATLPRLLNTLPPACLPFSWTGYSAQATAHPADCLPAPLLARLLCPGY